MAKELPYFKFFCSEWNDGDITLEDYNIQGLFINICSYYWSNNCDVDIKKLKKKFKSNIEDIDYLIKEGLMKVKTNKVMISFLIEQLDERGNLSSQNSINSKKRWDKIREQEQKESEKDATALKLQFEEGAESMQYRKEEIREDKKREDKPKGKTKEQKIQGFLTWFNNYKLKETGKIGKFKMLSKTDTNNLFKLLEVYDQKDFQEAIPKLYASTWAKENQMINPTHFLRNDNFNKYLNQELEKKTNINQQPAN